MAENNSANSRDEVLELLAGRWNGRTPCFSGLMNVTVSGLERLGLTFGEIHADPEKMAAAAATTYHSFGFESAVVPMDLCVEAEALGAQVDFRLDAPRLEFPRVVAPLADSAEAFKFEVPSDLTRRGRLPVVVEAIRQLKESVGREIVIGAWVPGPLTLAMQLIDLKRLTADVVRAPEAVGRLLDPLTDLLTEVGRAYRAAGADFLTVHEMGGSPGFIGPPAFKNAVQPRLKRLIAALPAPRVLSVCGDTNRAITLLPECGAEALSLDQLNALARTREVLGQHVLLFGNLDPIGTLANGDETEVRRAVQRAIDAGVDAVWPGCDLWPLVPATNMQAMVDEARNYQRR